MTLLIVGAFVSLLVQWLKNHFGTSQYKTLCVLMFLSVLGAAMYTYLVSVGYWQTVANILVLASAFYAIVLQRFEN